MSAPDLILSVLRAKSASMDRAHTHVSANMRCILPIKTQHVQLVRLYFAVFVKLFTNKSVKVASMVIRIEIKYYINGFE